MSLFNPLILLIFWNGALGNSDSINGWTKIDINTYYLLLVITNGLLVSHVADGIGKVDIRQGSLVRYLTRPFPYFWFKFNEELPYRILQGTIGFIGFIVLTKFIPITELTSVDTFTILIFIGAFFLSYMIQICFALIAFWITEIGGLFNTIEVARIVLGGTLLPLSLLPYWLGNIAYISPYAYVTYFPITSIQGKLSPETQIGVLCMQALWIIIFSVIYKVLWHFGLRKFSGVGQ